MKIIRKLLLILLAVIVIFNSSSFTVSAASKVQVQTIEFDTKVVNQLEPVVVTVKVSEPIINAKLYLEGKYGTANSYTQLVAQLFTKVDDYTWQGTVYPSYMAGYTFYPSWLEYTDLSTGSTSTIYFSKDSFPSAKFTVYKNWEEELIEKVTVSPGGINGSHRLVVPSSGSYDYSHPLITIQIADNSIADAYITTVGFGIGDEYESGYAFCDLIIQGISSGMTRMYVTDYQTGAVCKIFDVTVTTQETIYQTICQGGTLSVPVDYNSEGLNFSIHPASNANYENGVITINESFYPFADKKVDINSNYLPHIRATFSLKVNSIGSYKLDLLDNAMNCVKTVILTVQSHQWSEVYTIDKHPTCTEDGSQSRHCLYCDSTTDGMVIPAIGHDWSEPVYEWGANNATCKAVSVCGNDSTHVLTETAKTTREVTKTATCEEKGEEVYTAKFSNTFFKTQTIMTETPPKGHSYGTPTYEWAPDYSTCTARAECANDSSHVLEETVKVTSETTPATCTREGKKVYTAVFTNDIFGTKSDTAIIPALGHVPVVTNAVTPTCTEPGNSQYWTCRVCGHFFSDSDGEMEISEGSWIVQPVGHKLTVVDEKTPTCTEPGNSQYWTCRVCGHFFSDSDGEMEISEGSWIVQPVGHKLTVADEMPPTCTGTGHTQYWTCYVCNHYFSDPEGTTEIAQDSWIIPATGHVWDNGQVVTPATCTAEGQTLYTCTRCGATEMRELEPNGHTWADEYTVDQEPGCITDGSKSRHCLFCDQRTDVEVIPALGHDWDTENVVFTWSDDLSEAEAKFTCKRDHTHVETLKAAVTSETAAGIITYTATVVFEDATYTDTKTVDAHDIIRLFGSNRYATAIAAADHLKEKKGVETFDTIVIASGDGFPDALSASYLAYKKDGPILLYGKTVIGMLTDYVNDNLSPGGTVYIVGGEGVIPPEVEKLINGKVVRLAGANRYATNIAVLNEAGVEGKDLLVASGKGFADALSASAAKRPIFLVGNTLDKSQKDYLDKKASSMSGDIYIIGGQGAVSYDVEGALKGYGTVKRLSGSDRYKTSMAVADEFFKGNVGTVVIANGNNFPDGLSGGPIAVTYDAPLILVVDKISGHAEDYFKAKDAYRLIIMGGTGVIADETADRIFGGTE